MHKMTLINEHEGTEEWLCSSCGRHLLVSWHPVFHKIVLLEGDPRAKHSGSKKSLFAGEKRGVLSGLPSKSIDELIEEARLAPWVAWMDESGFESLWNKDI